LTLQQASKKIDKELNTSRKINEVNILLDSYADIFSDFDSSPYADKTLSDDFISQAKRISKNKTGKKIILKFFLPEKERQSDSEKIITDRLTYYFKRVREQLESEIKKTNLKGFLLLSIGIALMITASYISFIKPQLYYVHLLLVLSEPAGWFLLWAGLDNLVYNSKEAKRDLAFYLKMANSKIEFSTIKKNVV
jgi:hypothetical protein